MKKYFFLFVLMMTLSLEALAHEHHAPHGGLLVELGEEFAHIELVSDPQEGRLIAYLLDGEAENPVRISQKELTIISAEKGELVLAAQENVLSGETIGDTSEFSVQSPDLKGYLLGEGKIKNVHVKGQTFEDVEIAPEDKKV